MTTDSFSALNLPKPLLTNLNDLGYLEMTAIQSKALPLALQGKDLIAQAKTGSGKTAAFGIPLLTKLNPRHFGVQALVLCPTRELSTQVANEIRRLARYQDNIKVVTLCGGQSIGPQIGSLEHGAHIVVGTPGRIKDHLRKQTLSLAGVQTLVLDEADRMLEMGFMEDMETIIQETPTTRQTLLFSATFPENIETLSAQFQKSAEQISVESHHETTAIAQHFYVCSSDAKREALVRVLQHIQVSSAVIFCNTKQVTREVAEYLDRNRFNALAIHGDLEQRDRDQVLIQFRHQSCNILVATDVAARGLDIEDLPAVINFDLPRDAEVYVHRIGRTGRAGKTGHAISLLDEKQRYKLERIAEYQGTVIETENLADLTVDSSYAMLPSKATLCISGGRKDKVRPGDILGALTGDAGIDNKAVGKIDVMDFAAYVAIDQQVADKALGRLINGKIKGRKFKVRKL